MFVAKFTVIGTEKELLITVKSLRISRLFLYTSILLFCVLSLFSQFLCLFCGSWHFASIVAFGNNFPVVYNQFLCEHFHYCSFFFVGLHCFPIFTTDSVSLRLRVKNLLCILCTLCLNSFSFVFFFCNYYASFLLFLFILF